MSIVLDYTARIAPASLKAAGVSGVCRYISLPQQDTAWKRITLTEYRELTAAGIDVTLNFEYAATDWLGGAAAGRRHGQVAAAAARALGYPDGKVIPGSADFNMTLAQWQTSGAGYAREFAAAIRGAGYRPGVYGPWDVLTWVRAAGYMDAFWQAGMSTAWSSGRNANAWPGAHLRQRGHKTVGGVDTDWNEILIPDWGKKADDMAGEIADRALAQLDGGNALGDAYLRLLTGKDGHGKPSGDGASAANLTTLSAKLDAMAAAQIALVAKVDALARPAAAALTDADRTAIADQLGALVPTGEDIQRIVQTEVKAALNGTHLSA